MPLSALSGFASNIRPGPDGVWTVPTLSAVSYAEESNDACFALEDDSFWFRHRNQCILKAIRRFPPSGTFFDVGGGNGYVAMAIQESGLDVVLVEPGGRGVRNARKRGVANVLNSTLEDAGFFANVLPAVGMFDVIEHIEDDRACLRDVWRYLVPGGYVYVTVPAHQSLWSHEDVSAGHFRRYTLKRLSALLSDSGFEAAFMTYFFSWLVLPVFCLRALPSRFGWIREAHTGVEARQDHQIANPAAQRVNDWFSAWELGRLAQGRPIGVGASCLAVGRKPPAR